MLQGAPVAHAAARSAPILAHTKPIPVSAVVSHYHQPKALPNSRTAAPAWPSGTAQVALPAADAGTGGRSSAVAAAPSAAVRAGTLPIWISNPGTKAPGARTATASAAPGTVPSRVSVGVLPRTAAQAAGINGLLLTVGRADAAPAVGRVHLALDYSAFATAFGADWASRLHFSMLPACVLTTPQVAACRIRTPLASAKSERVGQLSADLNLAGGSPAAALPAPRTAAASAALASTLVLAADSSSGGGGGDFTATSLQPSGSWQAGGSADGFSWSYPMSVPSVPGGVAPKLSLNYDSQALDGLTSSTNNQASVAGDGFSLPTSYIERSYQSCHQNPTGVTKTQDNCWSSDNQLTLSLNGQTSTLVKDDTSGHYHPQGDANERVEYLTGAANGAQSGEYFRVTTADGTQYTFGLNELPGWASGKATTNSVWTEPVYATASGQPCYNATFADSWCQQAYRWNLDYVKSPHADVAAYFYTALTGYYARDLGTTADTPYIRDGWLDKVQYGQRDGSVYTTSPAGQVSFSYSGRCNTSSTGCATSTLASSTANWPDVPYDQNCANGAACAVNSPTFWSENELTAIQTQALVGTTETNVDSWAFTYSFPPTGDATTPSLWLHTIIRTGQDVSAGGSSTAIPMPAVTLSGEPLSNRVNLSDGYPPITRYRLNTITTETGGIINVGYSTAACASGTPSDPSQNTSLCYPAYWTPANHTSPIMDWFNKYIVTGVTQQDPTGGGVNDTITTKYTPVGTPAWHYDDNPLTPSTQRTWNQWRGYQGMQVTTGTSPDPVTETQYTYFRGMAGDTLPNNGTRTATVTDSRGDTPVTDAQQYIGQTYETIVYNGAGSGKIVTDTVTDPWSSTATATHALSGGLPSQQAFLTGTTDTKVYTPLASGSTRETETDYTHDSYGRVTQVNDQGDVSTTADDLCTTTTFADNTTAWILDTPDESKTVSVTCSTTPTLPGNAIADTRTFYDGSTTWGAAPTIGDVTMSQAATSYTGSSANFSTMSTATVDQYGRALTATDADQRKTTTAYTPATGAAPTSIAVTDPLAHTTVTTFDALRNLQLSATDPGGYVTSAQYDALGRTTAAFKPGIPAASAKYSYALSNSAPSVVTTQTLNNDGSTYRTSEVIYDALLRTRETQSSTPDGGRDVTDTVYNTDGWVVKSTDPYYSSGAPDSTLVQAQDGKIPSETGYVYDGAGRKTTAIAYALATQTWQSSTVYGGNFTTTIPPSGATVQSALTDARGHVTDLYQYHSGVPADPVNDPAADYTDTHYMYYPTGKQATEVDAAGNTWKWTYNLLGQQTTATDPDAGTSTTVSDNAGQLLSTTNGAGGQTSYSYDLDGRKTAAYDTTGNVAAATTNQIGAWTYDTLKKGYPTASTSYAKGTTSAAVTSTVLAYTSLAKVAATRTTLANLPTNEAPLAPSGGYVDSYSYNTVGAVTTKGDPAAGGLPSENIGYGYDTYGEPTGLASSGTTAWTYAAAIGYDEYGHPLQYTMGPTTNWVALSVKLDPQTNAVTDAKTTDSTSSTVVDDTSYTFGNSAVSTGAGLLTSTTDKQNGGATTDTQCYTYDWATRLNSAWTATDSCAATPTTGSSSTVGGPTPYWQSWTYTADGQRQTQTDHDTTGNTSNDTTTTYNYPAAGSSTDQPHSLTNTIATGPGATGNTASYTYDATGNTKTINGGATGNQVLTWNNQGKLATDTTGSGQTGYLYDTSGNLVLRTDPGQATLFLDDTQIVENTTTLALTATRYYSVAGATIAARTNTGDVQYLIPDRQGTDSLAIDYQTQTTTRRQYLPFGQTRGTTPTTWPGDNGYVGGTPDTTTQLENLGAREYNPNSGRFLSPDPILEAASPNQLAGYDYAGNNPTTGSDPKGLFCDGCSADANGTPQGDAAAASGDKVGCAEDSSKECRPASVVEAEWRHEEADWRHKTGNDLPPITILKKYQPNYPTYKQLQTFGEWNPAISYEQNVEVYLRDRCSIDMAQSGCLDLQHFYNGWNAVQDIPTNPCNNVSLCKATPDLLAGALLGESLAGPCSFAPVTLVLMADGHTKPIAKIKMGDKVQAADPTTGKRQGPRTVTATFINHDNNLLDLTIRDTHAHTAVLHTTSNHPFWDDTTHTWVPAGKLILGHALETATDQHAYIVSLKTTPGSADRYNLTVSELHTYYVLAGTTPVLVHNAGRGGAGICVLGQQGEAASGIVKNTQKLIINGRPRIPDELTATTLGEVKNVQYQYLSTQLKDDLSYAQANGLQFNLYVRTGTRLSGPLQDLVDQGQINLIRNLP